MQAAGTSDGWSMPPMSWPPTFHHCQQYYYHHHQQQQNQTHFPIASTPSDTCTTFSPTHHSVSPNNHYTLNQSQPQQQQQQQLLLLLHQNYRRRHRQSSAQSVGGAAIQPATMAEAGELEQMQRLSETYNPDLPGPLVGEKLPMASLVTEYSHADPAFVLKTQALAATHSGYRQIKGDGQCGWRGAVFGFFETLVDVGDVSLVLQEETRLQSFGELMKMAGIDYDIIVDMFEYTWELFDMLKAALGNGRKPNTALMEVMNDEIKSNSIVYHFKMMSSAFMQLYPENYEPFLDMPIADYRVARIDPSNQEIDQIGLQVLTDAVIAPAGFALDVLYLDRSIGNEVTPHEFAPKRAGRPLISMLYRPGHYDLIYKGTQPLQVYLQSGTTIPNDLQMADHSRMPSDFQAFVFPPSSSSLTLPLSSGPVYGEATPDNSDNYGQLDEASYLIGAHPHPPMMCPPALMLAQQYQQLSVSSCPSTISSPLNPPSPNESINLPRSAVASPMVTKQNPNQSTDGPRIRPTKYVMEYQLVGESVPLCTTAPGSTASLSTAHFRNEGFQPQIWKAEDEYLR